MQFKAPDFWWRKKGFLAYSLLPFSYIYAYFACKNINKRIVPKAPLPVLCIGNYTLGGNGKTPLAIAMLNIAKAKGLRLAIISRGYGGNYKSMHQVDPASDCSSLVGDEALLLATHATTIVTKNRAKAAWLLYKQGYDFVILDDGFQSRNLYYDYAIIALDMNRGLGNECVFPSGPLRAPLRTQLAYSDAVIFIGQQTDGSCEKIQLQQGLELYQAKIVPKIVQFGDLAETSLENIPVLSFCAIGNSNKFHDSIRQLGGSVRQQCVFADHHFFTLSELENILIMAKAQKLKLVTTQKDYRRLLNDKLLRQNWRLSEAYQAFLDSLIVLDIDIVFADIAAAEDIIDKTIDKYKQRLA